MGSLLEKWTEGLSDQTARTITLRGTLVINGMTGETLLNGDNLGYLIARRLLDQGPLAHEQEFAVGEVQIMVSLITPAESDEDA